MRIAMFTDNYLPNIDGVSVSVHTLVEGLRANGHEVRVLAPASPGEPSGAERLISVPVPSYPKYRAALPMPGAAIRRAVEGVDVVHTHGAFTLILLGRWIARRRRLPLVHTYHTLLSGELAHAPYIPAAWTRRYSRWYCNGCDHVVVPTIEISDEMRSFRVHAPVSVIPTGVDVRRLQAAAAEPEDLPAREWVVTFSRLVPRKSVDVVLAAFARVLEARPEAGLMVLGDGPSRPDLERQAARLGISRVTLFVGEVPHERVGAYLGAGRVFAFASLTETQGLTVQEAMAVGVPVVAMASRGVISSIRDGETGFLIPPGEVERFADRIVELLGAPDLAARMGSQARGRVEREASVAAMIRRMEEVYETVTAPRGGQGKGGGQGKSDGQGKSPVPARKLRIHVISETANMMKGQGVHTAFVDMVELLRSGDDVEVVVNDEGWGDLVHSHTYGPYFLRKAWRYRGRRVFTVHVIPDSIRGSLPAWRLFMPFVRWYLARIYRFADVCIAISPMVEEAIRSLNARTRVVRISNPVDLDRFAPDPEKRAAGRKLLGIADDARVVLGVGQLQGRKGVDTFLDVGEACREYTFVWVGGRPFGFMTEGIVRLNRRMAAAPANFRFPGILGLEEMPLVYNAADVFLFPSHQENSPLAPIEAAATGLPLVFRDIVEYRALYRNPYLSARDTAGFIELIRRLFDDPVFLNRARGMSADLLRQFSREEIRAQLVALYRAVLERAG